MEGAQEDSKLKNGTSLPIEFPNFGKRTFIIIANKKVQTEPYEPLEMKEKYQELQRKYNNLEEIFKEFLHKADNYVENGKRSRSSATSSSSESTTNHEATSASENVTTPTLRRNIFASREEMHDYDSDDASIASVCSSENTTNSGTTSATRNEISTQRRSIVALKNEMFDEDYGIVSTSSASSSENTPNLKTTSPTTNDISTQRRKALIPKKRMMVDDFDESTPLDLRSGKTPNLKIANITRNEISTQRRKILLPKNEIPDNDFDMHDCSNDVKIPRSVLESINWNSHTSATRKLLMALFDRETLATHSMSGKPSPAFKGQGKQVKNQLDPVRVAAIIEIVADRCGVPTSSIRAAITTKCADENKMFKKRLEKRRKQP